MAENNAPQNQQDDELSVEELDSVGGGMAIAANDRCSNSADGCGSGGNSGCSNSVSGCGG